MNKELEANTDLSHYRIVRKIGAGGMGEVYLAEDTKLRRRVALKVLPESIATDKERLRRFEQEAFAASGLNHPNILTIYEFGAENDAHFLASEFVAGETLRERMTREPLDLRETLDVALQVAAALNAAHEAGIVHRDIKPENVMLRDDRLVKVLDFGLAKLVEKKTKPTESEDETRAMVNTAPGIIMGTAAYMSPEQARGKDADSRSDIWSLGVCLYEMLARRAPFAEETVSDTIAAILKSEPAPLDESAPPELNRIIRKALQKNRDERYQTIKDFLLDLKNLKKELEFAEELERSQIPHSTKASNVGTNQTGENATAILAAAVSTHNSLPQQTSSAEYLAGEFKKPKLGVALASLILLAFVGVGVWFFFLRSSTPNAPIDSIAVLPFENRSGNADSDYLSEGLAESLIYRLSQLPNLKVSPTSSVFRYKGKETDIQKIGSELAVNAVLSGRILQRGENLTISVELVDVRNNKLLWGEQYQRKMSELLATQREMATEITQKLKLKLSGEGEKGLTKRYTDNNEAYQLYLKGRFHFAKRTKEDMQRSIEYFQQAVRLDPNFALAYSSIAECYNNMSAYPYLSSKDSFPQAKMAAQRALEIDPSLPEAHTALAFYFAVYDWNWAEAEREFKRAIELDPNNSGAHFRYAQLYLAPLGQHDEAITEFKRALELDPLSLVTGANLAEAYMYAGQIDQSLEQARRIYDLEPNFPAGRHNLGLAYITNGMYAEAIALSEKALQTDPTSQQMLRVAGCAYAKQGRRAEAEEIIKRFRDIAKTQYVMAYFVANIYASLGDKEKAFAELEKAYEQRDFSLYRIKVDPLMAPLRDDPRFKDLLRRMNLPE
jgi:eukaryotic-like serine/threonine-protein kinase